MEVVRYQKLLCFSFPQDPTRGNGNVMVKRLAVCRGVGRYIINPVWKGFVSIIYLFIKACWLKRVNEDDVDLNGFDARGLLGIGGCYLHSIVLIFWAANRIGRLIQGDVNSPISLSLLISFLSFFHCFFDFP